MSMIDLPLLLEMVIAAMIIATLDHPQPSTSCSPKPPKVCTNHWTPEHDLHAQRLLRLEARNLETSSRA